MEKLILWDGPGYFDVEFDRRSKMFVIQAREPDEDALVTVAMTQPEADQLVDYIAKAKAESSATFAKALQVAESLRSEDGENPEYDRALTNFISDLFPHSFTTDERNRQIATMIGVD